MTLKILLLSEVFASQSGVIRIIVETQNGSFGLLPGWLDCTAALVPGILTYATEAGEVVYVAVNAGVLVKTGLDVSISVRNALGGTDLGKLHEAVEKQFLTLDARQKTDRIALAKMESGLVRRFAEYMHESKNL